MTPRVAVVVRGTRRKLKCEAVIDTGFEGDLSLPVAWAVPLGLELVDSQVFELADGSRKSELVFGGQAIFQGKRRQVKILVSESDDALIGTSLLANFRLTIDFAKGEIQLVPDMGATET